MAGKPKVVAWGVMVAVVGSLLTVATAGPASAATPGTPGTPTAVAGPASVGLRWKTPASVGSPPVARYRIERSANGGAWTTAVTTRGHGSIATGSLHTCALLNNATVKCWGYNFHGQLGLGDTNNRGDGATEMGNNLPAVDLGTGRTATAIAAGGYHSCALLDNGSVKCWGMNDNGQLGLGDTNRRGDGSAEMGNNLPAVSLGTGRIATAISAGERFTCALLDNGSVKCWGLNSEGQLGLGDVNGRGDGAGEMGNSLAAVSLGTGRTATAISAGASHACALLDNASVKCWGFNNEGQLGIGDKNYRGDGPGEMGDSLPAVNLGTGRTATAVAAGGYFTCALLDNKALKCWGLNQYGALGQGDTAALGDGPGEMGNSLPAINLGTGRTAVAIVPGYYHACAQLDDGSVKCWGYNLQANLGAGNITNRGDNAGEMGDNLATVKLGASFVNALAAGGNHTCAVLDVGTVKCWGYNAEGQLGLGDNTLRGDVAGEMGDALATASLGTGRLAVPPTSAVLRTAAGSYRFRVVALSLLATSAASASSAAVRVTGVQASVGDAAVVEGASGNRALTFTVSLSAPTAVSVGVTWKTSNGTATTANNDYAATSGAVTIPAGSKSVGVSVPVKGDGATESSETFAVRLSNPTRVAFRRSAATGTILNDDPPLSGRRISIGNASLVEGRSGDRSIRFTVSLSSAKTSATSVKYATSNGTATGSDYVPKVGTVSIPAGTTSAIVSVIVRADTTAEGNETFKVTLSAPSAGVSLGRSTGTGTILNDD